MKTRLQAAFTLAELLVATSIFTLMIAGLVSITIFGLKQNELVIGKAGACEQARNAMNIMATDIRASKIWAVGNVNNATPPVFTAIPNGSVQQGNAVQVNGSTNTAIYVLYYFDTNNPANYVLRRWHTGNTKSTIISQYLTNNMFFRAETPRGNAQTNLTHKGVIHVYMEYCQYQYPLTKIGPGYYYDYYRTELKLTPHVPDGI